MTRPLRQKIYIIGTYIVSNSLLRMFLQFADWMLHCRINYLTSKDAKAVKASGLDYW